MLLNLAPRLRPSCSRSECERHSYCIAILFSGISCNTIQGTLSAAKTHLTLSKTVRRIHICERPACIRSELKSTLSSELSKTVGAQRREFACRSLTRSTKRPEVEIACIAVA